MRRHVIARHFVNNTGTLDELGRGVDMLLRAQRVVADCEFPIEFGLKLTVDRRKLTTAMREQTKAHLNRLPDDFFLLYDPFNKGPGTSYRQVLFNPTFRNAIAVNTDLDQYVLDTPEGLTLINKLADKVERKGALYANGSRNVPVLLATNPRNSDLRIIHELFHSETAEGAYVIPYPQANATPAHAELGESTSGLYFMNQAHEKFPELGALVDTAVRTANMDGFATDYYVAMRAPDLAPTATGYVLSNENKFYEQHEPAQEFDAVQKLIAGQTAEVMKTDKREDLLGTLTSPVAARKIAKFYRNSDVGLVRNWMIESAKSAV